MNIREIVEQFLFPKDLQKIPENYFFVSILLENAKDLSSSLTFTFSAVLLWVPKYNLSGTHFYIIKDQLLQHSIFTLTNLVRASLVCHFPNFHPKVLLYPNCLDIAYFFITQENVG